MLPIQKSPAKPINVPAKQASQKSSSIKDSITSDSAALSWDFGNFDESSQSKNP